MATKPFDQALESVPCIICGREDAGPWVRVGEWQLVRCRGCGLVYTNPRPRTGDLTHAYEEEYQEQHQDDELARQRRLMYEVEMRDILRHLQGGRFLDVGCGPGTFLAMLREHFEVYGVDVSRTYVRHAREVLGLKNVQVGQLSELNLPGDHFDVVQMRGVIQHLPHPPVELQAVFRVMRPGGLLVISATPNIESLAARIFRERFRLLAPDQMVYDFAPRTLRRLLEKMGFTGARFKFPYVNTPYFRWWQIPQFGLLGMRALLQRALPWLPASFRSPPFFGSMMTCYARKPSLERCVVLRDEWEGRPSPG